MNSRQLHLFRRRSQRGVAVDYSPSEFQLHCAVADTLKRWSAPNWLWCHYPAGEWREDVTAARLKRLGVKAGISDILLFPPAGASEPHVHCLELKRRGGKLSTPQAEFALWARLNGYPFAVADSYEAAIGILKNWGALRTGVHVQ